MITNTLFPLGQTVMTRSVAIEALQLPQLHRFVAHSLARHNKGDWGDICKADADMNDYAVKNGERLVSTYLFDYFRSKKVAAIRIANSRYFN